MTSDKELARIYNELLLRIQHIAIGLYGQRIPSIKISGHYDLTRTDTPSISETEDAFLKWNCAILTAFRGNKELPPEENLARNIKRNEELKKMMLEQGLQFRSVNGCYREAKWEKPNVEYCFFITNTREDIKEFFCKIYRLAEHYEQDSFLFTFPGVNRVAFLVATNDDGRNYFRDDIKFAGPLFTHVSDIGDWTDCSDGRISFRLKGMIEMGGTGNRKIKLGEGDMFDVESYGAKGLVVLRTDEQEDDLGRACKGYNGVPLIQHVFKKEPSPQSLHDVIFSCLRQLRDQGCKTIGFHCSVPIGGSYVEGAKIVYETLQKWARRFDKKFNIIVIVDIYGDYSKVLNNK
ncbi:MAG: hypothetical protein IK100_11845 [Muribaculaceae bacterium]|nr:hypothetical protein [Muribaculaceae bacterium]